MYPRRQWRGLLLLLISTLATTFFVVLQPLALKLLVDNAIGGDPVVGVPGTLLDLAGLSDDPRSLVVTAAGLAIAIAVVAALTTAALNLLWEMVGQRMVGDLMSDMHRKLVRLPLGFHARRPVGDSMSRLQWDSQAIYYAVSGVVTAPIVSVVTTVIVGLAAWRISPTLTIVIFSVAPVLAATARLLGPALRDRSAGSREARSEVTSMVTQILHALPAVQAFNAEQRNLAAFRTLSKSTVRRVRRETITQALSESLSLIISSAGTALVLVIGGSMVLDGDLTVGSVLVFIDYARRLETQAQTLMGVHRGLRASQAGLDRVLDVLDAPSDVPEPVSPVVIPSVGGGARVAFEAVSFGYEPGVPVLDGIDCVVEPGETVALVGATGAGKSTLAGLVPRFFDPWSGRVTLNGVDLRDATTTDVRSMISVVRQEPILLPVSVAANIAYGKPDATRDEVLAAADAAQASEFVNRMPDGFETVLGERGATLSGGQRQRLAIARALLKDAPVLILDEPTSALDAESEAAVVAALERVARDRTVFVIAHRLSTVRRADRIIVLDRGRVVETGTHDQLLAADGHYARYHRLHLQQPADDLVGTS